MEQLLKTTEQRFPLVYIYTCILSKSLSIVFLTTPKRAKVKVGNLNLHGNMQFRTSKLQTKLYSMLPLIVFF